MRTLNIPYPSVVKEQVSQPVLWKHENIAHREGVGGGGEKRRKLGSAVLWLLVFHWEKQPEFPVHGTVFKIPLQGLLPARRGWIM